MKSHTHTSISPLPSSNLPPVVERRRTCCAARGCPSASRAPARTRTTPITSSEGRGGGAGARGRAQRLLLRVRGGGVVRALTTCVYKRTLLPSPHPFLERQVPSDGRPHALRGEARGEPASSSSLPPLHPPLPSSHAGQVRPLSAPPFPSLIVQRPPGRGRSAASTSPTTRRVVSSLPVEPTLHLPCPLLLRSCPWRSLATAPLQ